MSPTASRGRVAGVTVPLFSLRSDDDWGIGDIACLAPFARWCSEAGLRLVQLLPLGEMPGGETSPYSALSAFGIDPIYIAWSNVPELPPSMLPSLPGPEGVRSVEHLRAMPRVDYESVRQVKSRALERAWARFLEVELMRGTTRARAFEAFCIHNAAWLDGYALFRALKDEHHGAPWWEWPETLRERDPAALDAARAELADAIGRYTYAQWVAHDQWAEARSALRVLGVEVMGDLPFMVGRDSADVWCFRGEFRDDASVGVPADQFDPEGQEWGLPPYRWDAMRTNDFRWLRRRAQYAGRCFDRVRVDHLVGFFRTYQRSVGAIRSPEGRLLPGRFDPEGEHAQREHGMAVVGAMQSAAGGEGCDLVAEDLGAIPDFVRPALAALDVPGYKVLIWEQDNGEFRDPENYPRRSVACFSTHDTPPLRVWWETRSPGEREAVGRIPRIAGRGGVGGAGPFFDPALHERLLDAILQSRAELVLLLVQDLLGTADRINTPGTVGPHNWTWRLPSSISQLDAVPGVRDAMVRAGRLIAQSGR